MNVLLIDAQDASRSLLKKTLEKLGHSVVESPQFSGDWGETSFDLLFLDPAALHSNSVQQYLRSTSPYVFLISDRNAREDVLSGVRAGATDYVTRPILYEEVMVRISVAGHFVERSRRGRALRELVRSIGHDINNSLTIVMGRSDALGLLLEDWGETVKPSQQEKMQKLCDAIHRASEAASLQVANMRQALEGEDGDF